MRVEVAVWERTSHVQDPISNLELGKMIRS